MLRQPDPGVAGEPGEPVLGYLRALQYLDRAFPRFSHDIHSVQRASDGTYRIMCLKDDALAGTGSA